MNVALSGGGTGGHIYPALSVAGALGPEDRVFFVGTSSGPEARIVPSAGLEFEGLAGKSGGHRSVRQVMQAGLGTLQGLGSAVALLRRRRPDVVIGFGGYASAACCLAASYCRVPVVLHEANAVPGRTNRWLARWARRVAVSHPSAARYFPAGKVTFTGMPIQTRVLSGSPEAATHAYHLDSARPLLLVTGGSSGARTLNRATTEAAASLTGDGIQLIHVTGRGQWDEVVAALPEPPDGYQRIAYADDMPDLLRAATLILCRAGSSTLAEVAAAGLPSITVPYPHAADDHQTANAAHLAGVGATVLVPNAELTSARLVELVRELLSDPDRLQAMSAAARGLARPDAAAQVVALAREVVG